MAAVAKGAHAALELMTVGLVDTDIEAMAEKIAAVIDQQAVLIAEAGTGTGKTFAYLLPALISGKKIIVSTGTKTLQDQLFNKDIPLLLDLLSIKPKVRLLKGRNNYLCLDRYHKSALMPVSRYAENKSLFKHLKTGYTKPTAVKWQN